MKARPLPLAHQFILGFAFTLFTLISAAQAQTFKVVHNFTGGADGANPLNGLMLDSTGTMYGTASAGGANNNGTVFAVSPTGALKVLYAFKGGSDGSTPQSFLIEDSGGRLYGTTSAGGTYGGGTVFRVAGSKETILYNFGSGSDGSAPLGGLIFDSAGNLYGTTSAGGASGNGTVFMLTPKGSSYKETLLYSFGSGTDGAVPYAAVALDSAGDVLGTTSAGGTYTYGTVFELSKANSWVETIVYNFENQDDGAVPYAGLVADGLGNFYGAATEGGSQGGGTVFELTPSGTSWNFSAIQSVPGWGISGSFRDVMLDSNGTIYATTHCDGSYDAGTVYQLVPGGGIWNYTLLYTFTGGTDGLYSYSNLVMNHGKLFGTTKQGGGYGNGVVFVVVP
jgi:uncharacterized repeat protein (TIGR03803 family)